MRKPAKKKIEAAIEQLDSVRNSWLRRPNVRAVDVGFKIKDDEITNDLAIRVHVDRKLSVDALEAMPEHETFSVSGEAKKLGDFPIDVLEADYAPAQSPAAAAVVQPEAVDRRSRVDPLVGGISVGNPRVTAGTLGAIVWDRTDCKPCMLSNWHVLVGSTAAAAGEPILQPGRADGGRAIDAVAKLKRWRLDRDADAALAELDGNRGSSRDILELSPITGIETPALGMEVIKSGRTTGVTRGIVDGVSTSIRLNYRNGPTVLFHDQIHIVPRPPWPAQDDEISLGGDSGSVWIEESSNKAVGLHFAGETDSSPSAEHAVANRMEKVAEILQFSFTPLFCRPPVPDDRLREILRRILCRHFPQLCRPRPAAGGEEVALPEDLVELPGGLARIDDLLDEILAEMQRSS